MDNFCIVVQGPSSYVEAIRNAFNSIGIPIIFSAWINEQHLYLDSDIVVFNEYPADRGIGNVNYQKVTTLAGLLKSKELGYTRALKFRSDMVPTNPKEFIKLFDNEKMNFFSWHYVPNAMGNVKGYMVDYFMSGLVDNLIKMWDFQPFSCVIPETMLTNSIIKHFDNQETNFVVGQLNEENDVHWVKYNLYLRHYKNTVTSSWFGDIDFKTDTTAVPTYKTLNR